MARPLVVTIDGPAGAGKSTAARGLARALGYLYVDTGAMYRAMTLKILRRGVDVMDDPDRLTALVADTTIKLLPGDSVTQVLLDGEDVSAEIRGPQVGSLVSRVARLEPVRKALGEYQQRLAAAGKVVLEGRDTGSQVVPGAGRKFYVTADFDERVRRRYEELRRQAVDVSLDQVAAELRKRDRMDISREVAPLVIPVGAIVIDTTHMDAGEVVDRLLQYCR